MINCVFITFYAVQIYDIFSIHLQIISRFCNNFLGIRLAEVPALFIIGLGTHMILE